MPQGDDPRGAGTGPGRPEFSPEKPCPGAEHTIMCRMINASRRSLLTAFAASVPRAGAVAAPARAASSAPVSVQPLAAAAGPP
ncbi:predicted protein [Streptomyces viridosporus ATCC 14672]|uniref:Predicted protein n=1 Tax=Streptomyces viridosporus (strain ATCC 14672 / DSM 40746 / JCM 4963 / KCTC 9882 / NRRL B-12104 / FH 1290) TaxID=566461 RepID=D6A5W8_STRV1|nr:predicted protein [Streptomyces viridosporus ATCC 14672]